ncbi:sensor histidine kinase [Chitinophaga parva]|uniref:histidine kinase n=1 Tax=Chitinophaga parva TaxID=2169414 RepID=A0A2T7BHT4_9BACT|nr:HAMP domain-containing sensor histidine kinase [Chitinophaga parva]PUZ25832.1 sensor histidine kinase [Chitinophaga parva]
MWNSIFVRVAAAWNNTINLGIDPSMPYIEARRTKLLNLAAVPGIFLMFVYLVLNLFNRYYGLAMLNLLNIVSMTILLVLHSRRMHLSARLIVISFSIVVYTISGLYFHNGAEYYLLLILIVVMLIYDRGWLLLCLVGLAGGCFVAVLLFPQPPLLGPPVSQYQVWSNIAVAIICMMSYLGFFKRIQADNLKSIEYQRQALLAMNKDKEKLFSILAHDIRSPLATLEGLLTMFHEGLVDDRYMTEATGILSEKITQFNRTLDNLLRWSTRNLQGIQTTPQDFGVLSLVQEVLDFFDLAIHQKKVVVKKRILQGHTIRADRDQVAVIFRNVFSNALKFSKEGGEIIIATELDGDRVSIRITDQGAGMSNRQLKSLFTSAQQPEYGTAGERGFGLGLLLSHEFAMMNNGAISVESNPGMGTTFTLVFPKGEPVQEEEEF